MACVAGAEESSAGGGGSASGWDRAQRTPPAASSLGSSRLSKVTTPALLALWAHCMREDRQKAEWVRVEVRLLYCPLEG